MFVCVSYFGKESLYMNEIAFKTKNGNLNLELGILLFRHSWLSFVRVQFDNRCESIRQLSSCL